MQIILTEEEYNKLLSGNTSELQYQQWISTFHKIESDFVRNITAIVKPHVSTSPDYLVDPERFRNDIKAAFKTLSNELEKHTKPLTQAKQ